MNRRRSDGRFDTCMYHHARINLQHILLSSKYLLSDIPCTLRHYQCSSISTPIMAALTVFAARISTFDNRRISNPALAFSVRSADTAFDGKYFTRKKRISTPSPTLANTSFRASIKSASDICRLVLFRGKRILLL